ncbi:MAG: DOPA 4,5-dioxygenase family protein [Hyphomicrobiaceae bacterium]
MSEIKGFHAHIYFDESTVAQATQLCTRCRDEFGVEMGRVHQKTVGPHPDWSCQLAFGPDKFADVVPWLMLNRDGLVVFLHPDTGEALPDHRDRAIWMGDVRPLNLSVFD